MSSESTCQCIKHIGQPAMASGEHGLLGACGQTWVSQFANTHVFGVMKLQTCYQKAADVWKKDVWDFQAFSQTSLELRFLLGNEGKD